MLSEFLQHVLPLPWNVCISVTSERCVNIGLGYRVSFRVRIKFRVRVSVGLRVYAQRCVYNIGQNKSDYVLLNQLLYRSHVNTYLVSGENTGLHFTKLPPPRAATHTVLLCSSISEISSPG